jgi:hypothetical protein
VLPTFPLIHIPVGGIGEFSAASKSGALAPDQEQLESEESEQQAATDVV